ncbi:MAG: winged helix-turn-helix transcriptional regulator [Methanobrevibacter boviskoreani]|jgi:DNA-binding HxlR family transcriptional regulator|uniref:winged helix-turn-helix transcriptional regulator n=1 Tax=Methanobrevibacter boviskoreani TaxID=1348249 RepID=UPI0006ACB41A|nr:helix-turn-helix domain-containing protein [Methanobrevibacter boviskoreani]MCI6929841.1 helix-turn-helix transcriptional regulator [Methanobrevibacter boviskoreani]MDD6256609.1 helix-turn-helix domain-containing protein [Methanobrevibacter boviskoreani]MDY5614247.1 helix-turn-helix domain-containing protein [Methanobrevibacter boviskoreani]
MSDAMSLCKSCPIEQAVNLIQKKWLVLIIRDMFFGKTHFNQFKENKPKLSNKVLSECLKYMEENELVIKIGNPDNKLETEYKLTEKGKRLNKVLFELAEFTIDTDSYYLDLKDSDRDMIKDEFRDTLEIENDNE